MCCTPPFNTPVVRCHTSIYPFPFPVSDQLQTATLQRLFRPPKHTIKSTVHLPRHSTTAATRIVRSESSRPLQYEGYAPTHGLDAYSACRLLRVFATSCNIFFLALRHEPKNTEKRKLGISDGKHTFRSRSSKMTLLPDPRVSRGVCMCHVRPHQR